MTLSPVSASSDSPNMHMVLGLLVQLTKTKADKTITNSKQNTSEEKGISKTGPYFSGLSGNLIRNSWFLYDLFSNVRIIFFTELSSNGSSWYKRTNTTTVIFHGFYKLLCHSLSWVKCTAHSVCISPTSSRAKGLHPTLVGITPCPTSGARRPVYGVEDLVNKYFVSRLYGME